MRDLGGIAEVVQRQTSGKIVHICACLKTVGWTSASFRGAKGDNVQFWRRWKLDNGD